jgi:hypothetical protein
MPQDAAASRSVLASLMIKRFKLWWKESSLHDTTTEHRRGNKWDMRCSWVRTQKAQRDLCQLALMAGLRDETTRKRSATPYLTPVSSG